MGKDSIISNPVPVHRGLKLWHGEKKQTDAYEQLYGYLESMHAAEGFLLTFDLHEKKKIRKEWISYKGKRILDLVI